MKLTEGKIRIAAYLIISIIVCCFLNIYCQYDYAHAEQFRLFRYSREYAFPLLTSVGGPATYLADYLTQFYILPGMGALVNTVFFLCIVLGMERVCRQLMPAVLTPFFSIVCGLYILVQETSVNYQTETTLAFIFALGMWNLCLLFSKKTIILLLGLAATALSYFLFGMQGAGCLLGGILLLLCTQNRKWQNWIGQKPKKALWTYGIPGILSVAAIWCGLMIFVKQHHPQSTRLKCLEVNRWNQDWDGILQLPYMKICPNTLYAAYQNLALAEKGELAEKLNDYPQLGAEGLWYDNHGLQHELMLLSDIYFIQGNVAMSKMLAFNGLMYNERLSNPRLMIRLIQTNLIDGAYDVAEKYISILEETRYYKEEAASYRAFLHHPEKVLQDPVLGPLKNVTEKLHGQTSDIVTDLKEITETSPDYKPAKDYLDSYMKLSIK